jgi:hypothetical protein
MTVIAGLSLSGPNLATEPPAAGSAAKPATPAPSPLDAALGWRNLDTPAAFRGYKQPGFPAKGWTMTNGVLTHAGGGGGGDLITVDQFGDFEFECEFRVAPKANSGIMFRVAEKHDATWQTGPEFQVFDDAGHGTKPTDAHACGALYDLVSAPADKVVKPAGEWNAARIRISNGLLQHYLNGQKVVETRVDGQPWKDLIAKSKFKDYEGFGVLPRGHIALQDHGDEVSYRAIRVRDLSASTPGEIALFDGTSTKGWTSHLHDNGKQDDVWTIRDGVLICAGKPAGYIRTTGDFKNFVLRLRWRFDPAKGAGNSGVLLRMVGADKVWPKSIEAQLHSGNAGDFWNIDNYVMTTDPARTSGRNTRKTHANERPLGEWNEYEIIVNRGDVILYVNGEELNRATGVEANAGKICLQSEGAEIHFRDIRLTPLPD